VSELNRIQIHVHVYCINWSTGISYPHSKACPLIGSFFLGFTYFDRRERENDRNIIFRCSFIGNFYLGFHIVTTGNVFLCLSKEHQNTWQSDKYLGLRPPSTNQIASCFASSDTHGRTINIYLFDCMLCDMFINRGYPTMRVLMLFLLLVCLCKAIRYTPVTQSHR
jgi:hypothetical protein